MLVDRHGILVYRLKDDDTYDYGTYDVITVSPGLASSKSQVRRLPRDEWAKSWLGDPAKVQYTEFPGRNTYDHDEIAKRAELALAQKNRGFYCPGFNSDKHFVERMAVKLERREWYKSPSEVVTDKAIPKVRVLSPHLELEVGDVVYVLRKYFLGFHIYSHVGVVRSIKESEIQIFHFNKDPPQSAKQTEDQDLPTSTLNKAQPKGYLHTTSLEDFCTPPGNVMDYGLYRAVFMEGTTRSKEEILKRIERFEEGDPDIFHKWAGLNPETSPHLEGAYHILKRNCETVMLRLVRAEGLHPMSAQVEEYAHKGTVGTFKLSSATCKDALIWAAKGPARLAVRRLAADNSALTVGIPQLVAGNIAGGIAAGLEFVLLVGTLIYNWVDKEKLSKEEYKLLQKIAVAEFGVGMGGAALIFGTTAGFGCLGGPPGIAAGVLTGIAIMAATYFLKRRVRAYLFGNGIKNHTSEKVPIAEEAGSSLENTVLIPNELNQKVITEHADKFPKQEAPLPPTDPQEDQQYHFIKVWHDDETGKLMGKEI